MVNCRKYWLSWQICDNDSILLLKVDVLDIFPIFYDYESHEEVLRNEDCNKDKSKYFWKHVTFRCQGFVHLWEVANDSNQTKNTYLHESFEVNSKDNREVVHFHEVFRGKFTYQIIFMVMNG